jgi:plastocyanin
MQRHYRYKEDGTTDRPLIDGTLMADKGGSLMTGNAHAGGSVQMARKILLAWLLAMLPGSAAAGQLGVSVADGSGKPVADAVVTLYPASTQVVRPTAAPVRRIVDQRNLMFLPYLQVLRPGDEVVFRNSDRTYHHVYSFSSVRAFEFVLAPGQSSPSLRLDKAGAIAVGCNIHDPMIAYLYVTDAPRFAQTSASGKVMFEDLAAGDYEVRVWQPRLRPGKPEPRQTVTLGATAMSIMVTLNLLPDPRQRADLEHVHY